MLCFRWRHRDRWTAMVSNLRALPALLEKLRWLCWSLGKWSLTASQQRLGKSHPPCCSCCKQNTENVTFGDYRWHHYWIPTNAVWPTNFYWIHCASRTPTTFVSKIIVIDMTKDECFKNREKVNSERHVFTKTELFLLVSFQWQHVKWAKIVMWPNTTTIVTNLSLQEREEKALKLWQPYTVPRQQRSFWKCLLNVMSKSGFLASSNSSAAK